MNAEKKSNKIAKYLSDNMVPEEREDLFAWIEEDSSNKALFEESLDVWEAAAPPEKPLKLDMDSAWSKMENRMVKQQQLAEVESTLAVVSLIRPLLRVAAAAILLIMAGLWYSRDYEASRIKDAAIVLTSPLETTTIDLPDGSKVWLNKNSEIKYEKLFEQRIVELKGEAFFEVAKKDGHSFEIYAGDSKTTVLGTSFNVRAYPEETFVEVAVATGKVHFSATDQKDNQAVLTKTEYATYSKETTKVRKEVGTQVNAITWKNQELYLEATTIGELITTLERYFNIKIELEHPKLKKCAWKSDKKQYDNPPLEMFIELIEYSMSYKFEKINATTYRVSGQKCRATTN